MSLFTNRTRSAQAKESLTEDSTRRDDVGQGPRYGQGPVDFPGWTRCPDNCGICAVLRARSLREAQREARNEAFKPLQGPTGSLLAPIGTNSPDSGTNRSNRDSGSGTNKPVRRGLYPYDPVVKCSRCHLFTSRPNDLGQCGQCSRQGTVGVIPSTESRDFQANGTESAPGAHSRVWERIPFWVPQGNPYSGPDAEINGDRYYRSDRPKVDDPFPVPLEPTTLLPPEEDDTVYLTAPPEKPLVPLEVSDQFERGWNRGYLRGIEAALMYVKNLDWGRERILESLENRRKWIEKRIENGKVS